MSALSLLQEQEWSMGNGQCPKCYGMSRVFLLSHAPPRLGHKADCELASAIFELGGEAVMIGSLPDTGDDPGVKSRAYWSEQVRLMQRDFDKAMIEAFGK